MGIISAQDGLERESSESAEQTESPAVIQPGILYLSKIPTEESLRINMEYAGRVECFEGDHFD
jgi:hypothetical protein